MHRLVAKEGYFSWCLFSLFSVSIMVGWSTWNVRSLCKPMRTRELFLVFSLTRETGPTSLPFELLTAAYHGRWCFEAGKKFLFVGVQCISGA